MSHLIEGLSRATSPPSQPRHHNATALRFALAGVFVALLLVGAQTNGQWATQVVPAALGFSTAILMIAAGVVGWERQVDAAESAGLVRH
ncbi:hypothetical protein [Mycolicibacterium mengxianglii]|uniref:hypothetical protein n=1 Tax=Mycolicibacterium mengxianglii TaxID=2736649 RepID=UPI0018EF1BD2|nr:hypothetical protein [Mycolicibacterium mengxianglii]